MLIGKVLLPCMSKLVGDFTILLIFLDSNFFTGEHISEIHFFFKAIAYRFRKDNEKAKDAFEKASKGQEMISLYPSEISLQFLMAHCHLRYGIKDILTAIHTNSFPGNANGRINIQKLN